MLINVMVNGVYQQEHWKKLYRFTEKVWLGWLSIFGDIQLSQKEQLNLQNKKMYVFFCFVNELGFQDGVAEDMEIHRMAV